MNERDYARRDAAMAEFVDSYFKARPQLMRTRHEECLVEAGFKAAWKLNQTERAERAEAELAKLREQEPVAWRTVCEITGEGVFAYSPSDGAKWKPLYAAPVPAAPAVPAPEIPDGDDFNGTTPHLIQCIEALVRMNDRGVLVPHGIGSHARTLLLASANRLRQLPAPSVPEEWVNFVRLVITEVDEGELCIANLADKGRALLQSTNHSGDVTEKEKSHD